ncbi:ADP-ribosylglycohydrolase family protein [Nocardia arizonensis]|uniref:ADP-ribosylglycohydrolase family protein n=1 Tax=Nocardia arizonensis TaxID=1141647 RepID=UPI0006CF5B75|nr:ADP-ribosylglycohydrolase family protein [Nocardia arizonensis]
MKIDERVRGSLVGGAIGDALGWPIEFEDLTRIRHRHGQRGITGFLGEYGPPQPVTDDTQMTLFSAEGLLRCPPGADPVPVLRASYLRWLHTQNVSGPGDRPDGWLLNHHFLYAVRAPGSACMSGLRRQQRGYLPPDGLGHPGPVNEHSKGCGTVMRSAPFGLAGFGPDRAFEVAALCAQLTHGHPTGYLAAGAFAALVDRVVSGMTLPKAVRETIVQVRACRGGAEVADALDLAVTLADTEPPTPETVERVGAGWIAEECLAIAVHCGLRAENGDIAAALLLSVNHSGDSDSTGAVAGNLIGAAHGISALPREWAAAVEGRAVLLQVADDLVANFFGHDRGSVAERYPHNPPAA